MACVRLEQFIPVAGRSYQLMYIYLNIILPCQMTEDDTKINSDHQVCFKVKKIVIKIYVKYIMANLQWCSTVMSMHISMVEQALWTKRVFENHATLARPSISCSAEIINCVHQLLHEILEITDHTLADEFNVRKSVCHEILTQGLCKMKLNVRLVSQKLTQEQNESHSEICAFCKLCSFNPAAD
jgi:hypothetical protein